MRRNAQLTKGAIDILAAIGVALLKSIDRLKGSLDGIHPVTVRKPSAGTEGGMLTLQGQLQTR